MIPHFYVNEIWFASVFHICDFITMFDMTNENVAPGLFLDPLKHVKNEFTKFGFLRGPHMVQFKFNPFSSVEHLLVNYKMLNLSDDPT